MYRWRWFGLALLTLASCDEATVITHIDRLQALNLRDLQGLGGGGPIAAEIHGVPWAGANAAELAAALRPPAGTAQRTRFSATPVGSWQSGHGVRLVLHFNPVTPANGPADCRRKAETRSAEPARKGFAVTASFCRGQKWLAHGHLEAPGVSAGDLEGYSVAVRSLFVAIFREEPDR